MNDIEIANRIEKKKITEIAKELGIENAIESYGDFKAKIRSEEIEEKKKGKLILVTAMNPTPYGEGKTTVSIGLNDGLRRLKKNSIAVLREPSLGPVFGIKGGATGGGYSQVVPMEDINLHFTGDFHAITTANNLISAAIDNHLYFGNTLEIDEKRICFKRCLDMNDRALRKVSLENREESFQITAASEIMSILCLSENFLDLKRRLANILLAYNQKGEPIYTRDLKLEGSLATILKDAIKPNLVQSLENNPVILHGGPFANIAHGCNSVVATKLGLKLCDYVVTEAGFGSDLGAEKFLDIKCRKANLTPDCIAVVATIRALKHHGGSLKEEISKTNLEHVQKGLANLNVHINNMLQYTNHVMVVLNRFHTDTEEEIELVRKFVEEKGLLFSVTDSYQKGGAGAIDFAEKIIKITSEESSFQLLYKDDLPITEKIAMVAKKIYHASRVIYQEETQEKIDQFTKLGYDKFPVCIAKTQYSISDDQNLLGAPEKDFVTVRDVEVYTGAEFIVVYLGTIMTMPGLSRKPNYENIDIDEHYQIKGLF